VEHFAARLHYARMDPLFLAFPSRKDAADALALRVENALTTAAIARGAASAVMSGGESPRGLLRMLGRRAVPWSHVTLVPSDERCVAPDDHERNERMIRNELCAGEPVELHLLSLCRSPESPEDTLAAVAADLATVPRPFDTVVLGMGADGHTASLFPDAPGIAAALETEDDVIVQRVARLPVPRVSLTPHALADARELNVLLFGWEKRAVYERALKNGPAAEYPIRAVIRRTPAPVTAYWAP